MGLKAMEFRDRHRCKRKFEFWAGGEEEKRFEFEIEFEFKGYRLRWRKWKVDDGHRSSGGYNQMDFLSFWAQ